MQKDIWLSSTYKLAFDYQLKMSNICQVGFQPLRKSSIMCIIWVYGYFLKSFPFYSSLIHVLPNPRIPVKVFGSNPSQMHYLSNFRNGSPKVPCKCISLHAPNSITHTSFVHHQPSTSIPYKSQH